MSPISIGLLCAVGLVVVLPVGSCLMRRRAEAPFRDLIRDYADRKLGLSSEDTSLHAAACRTGKVLVLSSEATHRSGDLILSKIVVSDVWHDLPSDMRATSPEDLDTLIIASTGTRWDPRRDYVQVVAYDMKTRMRLGVSAREHADGEDPDDVLLELIRGLEIRN